MKVSVIGTGKTGSAIAEILGDNAVLFNTRQPANVKALEKTDIAIIFVPGDAAPEIIDILLEANIPAVWGTTGYQWPADLPARVKKSGKSWVIGSNFSLGMNLVRKSISIFGQGAKLLKNPEFHIHEVHHIHKKDSPSGTALAWEKWLGHDAFISSDRQGDVKGIHNLHIKTEGESIYLKHEAHNRAVFAEGAVWCAKYMLQHPHIDPGVYTFSDIFDRAYKELI